MLTLTPTLALREGFSERGATLEDIPIAVHLLNVCSREEMGKDEFSEDYIRGEWIAPHFHPADDIRLVFATDDTLVGYIEVWDAEPVTIWTWGRVHPDYRNLGIGTYLLNWAENRARQAIAKAPAEARVVLRCGSVASHNPSQQLMLGYDMPAVRHFWRMRIDFDSEPTTPVWPEGITVRPAVRDVDERAVLAIVRASFQDHWGYVERPFDEHFSEWMHEWTEEYEYDPSLWFLALDGEQIIGVALSTSKFSLDADMGWIATIGVLRGYRRRGIGEALLHHAFRELHQRGKQRAGLGVDASNLTGATRIYEKAGMYVAHQFVVNERELRPGLDLTRQS